MEQWNWDMITKATAVLDDQQNQAGMIDLDATREMISLNKLPPHKIARLMAPHLSNLSQTSQNDVKLLGDK
ncbi:hypothetical protein NG799_27965 [Laspinema sp. D1]|uniref:Uncharacterized protein n=1 Tax=Laspinema palackyanum D2a TaxID=2953684 RepID=A0ABT2N227_9CYAN|nr:hypothetical protein [Laspinema sp. D2a]